MTKAQWRVRIKKAMEQAGTFAPHYNITINLLASVLEVRDREEKNFKAEGCQAVVEHINQGGASNMDINPSFKVIQQCNNTALSFLSQLGLTPRALKSVGEQKESSNDKITEWMKRVGV